VRRNPREGLSPFVEAFSILNALKRRKVITNWAVYGAIAYVYHAEVIFTLDIDFFITTRTEQDLSLPEYRRVLRAIEEYVPMIKGGGAATFDVRGRPMQVFQARGDLLWESAVRNAIVDRVGGEPVRVVDKEHLILLALRRFSRAKDTPRIADLYETANKPKLRRLIRRFDADGQLKKNLDSLLAWLHG
jgi:hypothetical protein